VRPFKIWVMVVLLLFVVKLAPATPFPKRRWHCLKRCASKIPMRMVLEARSEKNEV
jgi:hypothetical protein